MHVTLAISEANAAFTDLPPNKFIALTLERLP
jgi:hypothetical protein